VTDYRDLIYSDDWRAWRDPDVPEYFNPTTCVLDKHIGTARETATALIVDADSYSYGEILALSCRAAAGLGALGLEVGSRLLLFGTDSVEYIATWLGAVRAGIVPVTVSDFYKAPMLGYFLGDTAAKTLFIDAEHVEKLAEIGAELPASLKQVIVRGENTGNVPPSPGRANLTYADMVAGQADNFTPVPLHHNDVAYMFYSGGTTGTAKGITHLAHDFHIVPERHGALWGYSGDDVVHATSKKYFTHGLWPGVLIPFYWGGVGVASRLPAAAENVAEILERTKATMLITVPTIVKNLLLHIEETDRSYDFSALRMAVSASEKMPPEIFDKFVELVGVELMDSIGSSEITYEWIANRPQEFRRGSLGKPVFGCEVKLMDADGNEVTAPGTDGECWIKSRTTCFYYWRKLDKSRDTFIGEWARTGDTLQFDDDGFFWFSGRSDDVFKVKGLWVSPLEVEAAITGHEAVLEAAVISFEGRDGLTRPKAFVVLRPGIKATDALSGELEANVRAIGGYKVPDEIEYVAALPRTTLLKIDRRTLREEEAARRAAALPRRTGKTPDEIIDYDERGVPR
jgi:benzoate-CoA ligase